MTRAQADLQWLAQRLEQSGTAIVVVGGQEFSQDVTQHFVTLVRSGLDGHVHVLDSMNPRAYTHFETAREALLAYLRTAAGGEQYLSVLMPRQGRVLPPAPLNPQGAYLPNRGFIPLNALQEADLEEVQQLHGDEARERLESAIALQPLAAVAADGEDSSRNEPQYNVSPSDDLQTQGASRSAAFLPPQYLEVPVSAAGQTSGQGPATGSNNVIDEAHILQWLESQGSIDN